VIGCPQQTISEQTSSEQTSSEQTSSQQTDLQIQKPLGDVMINLDQTVPAFFGQFERVAEIVSGDDTARDQARQRYKYYRDRGYTINTHNIG
jgi:DNA polymerase IIIc chi subunit